MKLISTERKQLATNCDGPLEWFTVELFEVEPQDVGTVHSNYRGFKAGKYVIREHDVGRVIEERSQNSIYTCWFFKGGQL